MTSDMSLDSSKCEGYRAPGDEVNESARLSTGEGSNLMLGAAMVHAD